MSISLVVDGSPASCRQAAHDLRELGGRVTAASDMLARAMGTAAGCWTGECSDAFTDFVRERIHRADGVADEINLFAGALEGFGAGLADVKSEMKRARAIAVAAEIPVSTSLPEVGEVTLKPGQEAALDHAVGVATRAHEHEHRLHEALLVALGQVNTLVWQEFDFSTIGKAASGGGSTLGDLIPDLPDLSEIPVPGPILGGVDPRALKAVTGHLQGAFTTGKDIVGDILPGGPRVLGIPAIMLMNPHMIEKYILLKAVKRVNPTLGKKIDEALLDGGKLINKLGHIYCGVPTKIAKELPLPKMVDDATVAARDVSCKAVEHDVAERYTKLIVEATDAK